MLLGLAAVVVVAAVGVLAASASAEPTWYECGKAAKNSEKKYTGKYTDKLCTKEATPTEIGIGKSNKYELQPGVGAKPKAFKGKAGVSELDVETPYGNFPIECASGSTSGTPAVPNLETAVSFSFKKCSFERESCKTPGGKKGEIKGSGLVGELGYVEPEEEDSPPAVGLEIKSPGPEGEKVAMAMLECGEGEEAGFLKPSKLLGAVIGVVEKDVNVLTTEQTLTYKALPQFGKHVFAEKEYTPLVNIVGFESEVAEIQRCSGQECTEEFPAHVLRGEYCGKIIEGLISEECTPPTYTGLDETVVAKGGALMIKA